MHFLKRSRGLASESADLIAEACSERRTLALRVPGAKYAPLQRVRADASMPDQPLPLLEAEARVSRLLQDEPNNPAIVSLKGRIEIIRGNSETAIADLHRALDADPKSTAVLNDLASAYFQRGETNNDPRDYGIAFELQSRALEGKDDIVALFNRAITAYRLFLLRQSREDWQHYLRLDGSSEWSHEARERLAEVLSTLEIHDREAASSLLTPAELVRKVNLKDQRTWEQVDPRIEEYVSVAISSWLPSLHLGRDEQSSLQIQRALTILATILQFQHKDNWLSDFLSQPRNGAASKALIALSQAFEDNHTTDDYAKAVRDSRLAVQAFRQAGNSAGVVRAALEEVTALHFSDAAHECLSGAQGKLAVAAVRQYSAVETQFELEAYNCAVLMNQFDRGRQYATKALGTALDHHFGGLAITATTFLADADYARGHRKEAWRSCNTALRQYWSSNLPASRAYGPYVVLDLLSQAEEMWHLDFAVGLQALELLPETKDPLMRAEEHTNLAHAAAMAGDLQMTSSQLTLAKQALDEGPRSDVTENYRFDLKLFSSWLQGRTNPADGIRSLDSIGEQLAAGHNETLAAKYHLAKGELLGAEGNLAGADQELSFAVYLSERQRSSLHEELDRASWIRGAEEPYRELAEVKRREGDPWGSLAVMELFRGSAVRANTDFGVSQHELTGNSSAAAPFQTLLWSETSTIRQTLSQQHNMGAVIVYGLLPRGLGIWLYNDREGLDVRMLETDPRNLLLIAKHFEELCARPSSSLESIQVAATELYALLIAPIANKIVPGKPLLIEVDPSLSSLPFQALMDPTGHYLADDHTVLLSPGLHYLQTKRTPYITSQSRALVVANTTGGSDSGLQPVNDVVPEAQRVATHFATSQLLVGDRASIEEIKRDLPQAAVFHFAGHAGMNNGEVGLLLNTSASDSSTAAFTASDVKSLPVLQLAVLSACSTEQGSSPTILDPESLVRAMLRAGAADVVASRWNIDSTATGHLMPRFYDLLLSGKAVPAALNEAEISLRQEYVHPYYWAAFAAFGKN
jgi:CHAT domain-containing protein/tetratricopeptide (TPR) repeat protein